MLVVGDALSGKTTFIDYLCLKDFQYERETLKTISPEKTRSFDAKVGQENMYNVSYFAVGE